MYIVHCTTYIVQCTGSIFLLQSNQSKYLYRCGPLTGPSLAYPPITAREHLEKRWCHHISSFIYFDKPLLCKKSGGTKGNPIPRFWDIVKHLWKATFNLTRLTNSRVRAAFGSRLWDVGWAKFLVSDDKLHCAMSAVNKFNWYMKQCRKDWFPFISIIKQTLHTLSS